MILLNKSEGLDSKGSLVFRQQAKGNRIITTIVIIIMIIYLNDIDIKRNYTTPYFTMKNKSTKHSGKTQEFSSRKIHFFRHHHIKFHPNLNGLTLPLIYQEPMRINVTFAIK
jgi:hypothetical protein